MSIVSKKRINITLSPETLELIDRVNKSNRSRFIDEAVKIYAHRLEKAKIREKLKQAYLERAEEDLAIAKEWEAVEKKLWEKLEKEEA